MFVRRRHGLGRDGGSLRPAAPICSSVPRRRPHGQHRIRSAPPGGRRISASVRTTDCSPRPEASTPPRGTERSDGGLIGSCRAVGSRPVRRLRPNDQSPLATGARDHVIFAATPASSGCAGGRRGSVPNAAFRPDGRTVVPPVEDHFARVGRGLDQRVPTPRGAASISTSCRRRRRSTYRPDGKLMLSAGTDEKAHLWHTDDGSLAPPPCTPSVKTSFRDAVRHSGGLDRTSVRQQRTHGGGSNHAVLSQRRASCQREGRGDRWPRWMGPVMERSGWEAAARTQTRRAGGRRALGPDGRLLVGVGQRRCSAALARRPTLVGAFGHAGDVVAAAFSPDGRHVRRPLRIRPRASGRANRSKRAHAHPTSRRSHPRSPSVRTGLGSSRRARDRDTRAWNVGLEPGRTAAVHCGPVLDVAFSADGRWIATAGPSAAGIWEASKGRNWPTLPIYFVRGNTRPMSSLAFSPSGWHLLMGSKDGSVRTFDCKICGGMKQLTTIARGRLAEIKHVKR